jgi:DeoR/GlpR family transcriptional regulator of sugar metabolism
LLQRLLGRLQEGGTRSVADLARELNTTPGLVRVMLEDLVRMRYLVRVSGSCAARCESCPLAHRCATGDDGHVWVLTNGP